MLYPFWNGSNIKNEIEIFPKTEEIVIFGIFSMSEVSISDNDEENEIVVPFRLFAAQKNQESRTYFIGLENKDQSFYFLVQK